MNIGNHSKNRSYMIFSDLLLISTILRCLFSWEINWQYEQKRVKFIWGISLFSVRLTDLMIEGTIA